MLHENAAAKGSRNLRKYLSIQLRKQRISHRFGIVPVLTFLCSFSFQCVPGTTKGVIQVFEGNSVIDDKILPVS